MKVPKLGYFIEDEAVNRDTVVKFARELLHWNRTENDRQMPWKGEKDPYKIWLSEVILQQTRVDQGLKYYENFITNFPDVFALAGAPDEKVFKLWEGLGYYSRCRNLIASARYIAEQLHGVFPRTYDEILKLKGVGNYTAAAIASFASNLPYAVLDGNVFRVLSRIFAIDTPVDDTAGKKLFASLAQGMLPAGEAASYNQAIMDFGAVVCKPVPLCDKCFFNTHCAAFLTGKQNSLPVKSKKIVVKERWLNYLILTCNDHIAIHQRTGNDIWQQLFEFLLIESESSISRKAILARFHAEYGKVRVRVLKETEADQRLTHQIVHFRFLMLKMNEMQEMSGYRWIPVASLEQYAFPKTIQQFILEHLR